MKLMTKRIARKLAGYPLGSQQEKGTAAEVLVKYYSPDGHVIWLITEGEQLENGDWKLYGYYHVFEWKCGYVMLSKLESPHTLPCGRFKRDYYIKRRCKAKDLM